MDEGWRTDLQKRSTCPTHLGVFFLNFTSLHDLSLRSLPLSLLPIRVYGSITYVWRSQCAMLRSMELSYTLGTGCLLGRFQYYPDFLPTIREDVRLPNVPKLHFTFLVPHFSSRFFVVSLLPFHPHNSCATRKSYGVYYTQTFLLGTV